MLQPRGRRLVASVVTVLGAGFLISACGGDDDSSPPANQRGEESFQSAGEGPDATKTVMFILTAKQPRLLHVRIRLDAGETIVRSGFHSLDTAPVSGPGQNFGFSTDSQSVELRCAPTTDGPCGVRAILDIASGEQLTGTLQIPPDSDDPTTVEAVVKGKSTTLRPGNFTLPL